MRRLVTTRVLGRPRRYAIDRQAPNRRRGNILTGFTMECNARRGQMSIVRPLSSRSIGPKSFVSNTSDVCILEIVQDRVETGVWHADQAQFKAAKRFKRLQQALVNYDNEPLHAYYTQKKLRKQKRIQQQEEVIKELDDKESSTATRETVQEDDDDLPRPSVRIPRGLYLYGSVGTGKSMLMDTFYDSLSVTKKRRCHFHAFLSDVHGRIHQLKQQDLQTSGRDFHVNVDQERNPIYRVGLQLSREISVLCLDEFQGTHLSG